MRCLVVSVLGLALGVPAGPARAQADAEQVMLLLKVASAQSAVITFCAKHFTIDGTTALRISQTTREVAARVLGQARAEAAFRTELARRFDEVRAVGERQWCADQRDALADDTVPIFKD